MSKVNIKDKIAALKANNAETNQLDFFTIKSELQKFIQKHNTNDAEFMLHLEPLTEKYQEENDRKLYVLNFLLGNDE